MQPDGDLMFDAGAMWVAAKHRIPLLVVMYNKPRLLQRLGAPDPHGQLSGRRSSAAHIGMDMSDPDPDFASMAKSWGGTRKPDRSAEDVAAALSRAIAKVKAGSRHCSTPYAKALRSGA